MRFLANSMVDFSKLKKAFTKPREEEEENLFSSSKPTYQIAEEYKDSYSNGFEAIYAIEKVDLKTVRPFKGEESGLAVSPITVQNYKRSLPKKSAVQLELDLGAQFNSFTTSLRLEEPIEVLNLSTPLLKKLLDCGLKTVRELLLLMQKDNPLGKGLGQGHLDEIKQSLDLHAGQEDFYCVQKIELLSLLKCLLGTLEKKAVHLFLSLYGLNGLFSLSAEVKAGLRQLSGGKEQEYLALAMPEIRSVERCNFLSSALQKICQLFLMPWIYSRQGIATEEELLERIERHSESPQEMKKIWKLITETYYKGQDPLVSHFPLVERKLYAADERKREAFEKVVIQAKSYFYSAASFYPLKELVSLMIREKSAGWEAMPAQFIEKVLRYSSTFRVRKEAAGLTVRLNVLLKNV